MILFRRAAVAVSHIEDREWVLLALETVGVLAGILIAFSLQEWGTQRDQAAKHHELMERLFEESQGDVSVIRDLRNGLKPMINGEQAFAVRLANSECPADKDFQALTTLAIMPALTPPTSVYQELMGAGGLASIERKDVREHLAQFHTDLEWAQKQIDYFRAGVVIPVPVSDPRVRTRFDPTAEEPEVSTFDGHALCSDQAFKNRLAAATRSHSVYLSFFQGPLEDAISVCVRLGASLGHRCAPPFGGPLLDDDAKYANKVEAKMQQEKSGT
jgi:hypothetical protein